MKIPAPMSCQICKEPFDGTFVIGSTDVDWHCTNCGSLNVAVLSLDYTVGRQLLNRSLHELNKTKDFSIAVILAAAAVECELADLYIKWTTINDLGVWKVPTDNQLDIALRKLGNIDDKLKAVTKLLVPGGIETFVTTDPGWRNNIAQDFPEIDPLRLIQTVKEQLFWPRNRILHRAQPPDLHQAERCVKIAQVCLQLLFDMDRQRRDQLERTMKAQDETAG